MHVEVIPGPGGWAALIRDGGAEKVLSGAEPATTNNRMEVMAAIEALRSIERPSRIRITTDSEYLRQGITSWMKRWKSNGWRTAAEATGEEQRSVGSCSTRLVGSASDRVVLGEGS